MAFSFCISKFVYRNGCSLQKTANHVLSKESGCTKIKAK
uniref:Uncharacterized protein n=1 Tax=Anguilla anguilla TaxID=7936 RepID=A0A0E9XCN4_ANGAN